MRMTTTTSLALASSCKPRPGSGATPGGLSIFGDLSGNSFSTTANGALTRTVATGYTPFEFSGNNYSSFTVSGLAGADTLDLVSLGSSQTNNFPITLNGDTEADTIRVRSTSGNTGPVTLNGGAGSDLLRRSNLFLRAWKQPTVL